MSVPLSLLLLLTLSARKHSNVDRETLHVVMNESQVRNQPCEDCTWYDRLKWRPTYNQRIADDNQNEQHSM